MRVETAMPVMNAASRAGAIVDFDRTVPLRAWAECSQTTSSPEGRVNEMQWRKWAVSGSSSYRGRGP
jgi:hypothetical protein